MSHEDELLAEARAALAELHEAFAEIDELMTEVVRSGGQDLAQDAERDEERARLARRGDLGPQWRRLQERIDAGDTSLSSIARGHDMSSEAVDLRAQAHVGLAELTRLVRDADGDDGSAELPVIHIKGAPTAPGRGLPPQARAAMAEAKAAQASLEAVMQRVRQIPVADLD
jgi:hypothetical protein